MVNIFVTIATYGHGSIYFFDKQMWKHTWGAWGLDTKNPCGGIGEYA